MDLRTGSVVQFLVAAVATAPLAVALEDMRVDWNPQFAFALLWLVLVLSIGAVSLLYLLIRRGAAAQVVSLFFLVPPCTALIAWPLFGETLSSLALVGMSLTAVGVFLARQGAPPTTQSSGGGVEDAAISVQPRHTSRHHEQQGRAGLDGTRSHHGE